MALFPKSKGTGNDAGVNPSFMNEGKNLPKAAGLNDFSGNAKAFYQTPECSPVDITGLDGNALPAQIENGFNGQILSGIKQWPSC